MPFKYNFNSDCRLAHLIKPEVVCPKFEKLELKKLWILSGPFLSADGDLCFSLGLQETELGDNFYLPGDKALYDGRAVKRFVSKLVRRVKSWEESLDVAAVLRTGENLSVEKA